MDRAASIAQICTGIAALAAAMITTLTVLNAQQSVEVSNKQANEAEQRQVTERFSSAVEQLGSESEEVRVGGVYALERIILDSERDRSAVIEVLCAFVRHRAPYTAETGKHPETDIQAVLTVIARRQLLTGDDTIDLSHTNLPGVELDSARLRGPAHLGGTNLEGANLAYADLNKADLRKANLAGARLVHADLHAYLDNALLAGADLTGAEAEGASFVEANLSNAVLVDAKLTGTYLTNSSLNMANLSGAQLGGAKLGNVRLAGANLLHANLTNADLSDANLTNAKLGGSNLTHADLAGARLALADLRGADLTNAHNVTFEQLREAVIDGSARLPPGFSWTPNGVVPN